MNVFNTWHDNQFITHLHQLLWMLSRKIFEEISLQLNMKAFTTKIICSPFVEN